MIICVCNNITEDEMKEKFHLIGNCCGKCKEYLNDNEINFNIDSSSNLDEREV